MNYYGNSYTNNDIPPQYMNQFNTMPRQFLPQPQGLNGKIVDSEEVARASDVPIGGYGMFPKADLSEVYFKIWKPNGTTDFIIFKPVEKDTPAQKSELTEILERLTGLEAKIDKLPTTVSNSTIADEKIKGAF